MDYHRYSAFTKNEKNFNQLTGVAAKLVSTRHDSKVMVLIPDNIRAFFLFFLLQQLNVLDRSPQVQKAFQK